MQSEAMLLVFLAKMYTGLYRMRKRMTHAYVEKIQKTWETRAKSKQDDRADRADRADVCTGTRKTRRKLKLKRYVKARTRLESEILKVKQNKAKLEQQE